MHKVLILIILFFGILFMAIEATRVNAGLVEQPASVIYRYIPRTFEEEQLDPVFVSDVFEVMFSQPSPWVGSVRNYDRRKQERINKYFVTQM